MKKINYLSISPIQPHHLEALKCIKCYDAQNEKVPSSREALNKPKQVIDTVAGFPRAIGAVVYLSVMFRFLCWKSLRCLFASSTSTSFCIFIIFRKAAVPKLLI